MQFHLRKMDFHWFFKIVIAGVNSLSILKLWWHTTQNLAKATRCYIKPMGRKYMAFWTINANEMLYRTFDSVRPWESEWILRSSLCVCVHRQEVGTEISGIDQKQPPSSEIVISQNYFPILIYGLKLLLSSGSACEIRVLPGR